MSVISTIKSLLGLAPAKQEQKTFNPEHFIYVKLPGNLMPLDRGAVYEDPIEQALSEGNLGTVSGGGSSLGDKLPDGSRIIEFSGIDIDTDQPTRTLEVLRDLLRKLDAPAGTELHYTRGGAKLQDQLSSTGWRTAQQREFLHPGFGV
ncbi:hypothetical protein DBR12_03765 [Acidovorax sp. HMWF029]|uniref:hypothetical protein n=1 Tax=Acidovorax sp. HMWF029 TaxID=2056863 RepID=UPI000D3C694A|nr:hypothetical protein [Acidovorax sp. HMWF029]PTT22581.1 hypothetical protein DBR12_03765 [Acidovorax sp. HMWF029]